MFEKKTCFIESCRWVGLTVIILTNNATHWGEPTGVVDDQEAPAGNQWQHCRIPRFDWPTTDLYQIQRVPSTCIYDIISSSWWIGKKLWKRERERDVADRHALSDWLRSQHPDGCCWNADFNRSTTYSRRLEWQNQQSAERCASLLLDDLDLTTIQLKCH